MAKLTKQGEALKHALQTGGEKVDAALYEWYARAGLNPSGVYSTPQPLPVQVWDAHGFTKVTIFDNPDKWWAGPLVAENPVFHNA